MRFSRLRYAIRLTLYGSWNLLFYRLPNVGLYELGRLFQHHQKGKSDAAWVKIEKTFFRRFSHGPMVTKSMVLALMSDGSKLYCPVNHLKALVKTIYYRKMYDKFFSPRNGDTIADVGAHAGMYTLKAARKVKKRGQVLSIEPHPYTFRLLVTNLKMNDFSQNVIPINIGLADFKGKARLYLDSEAVGHSLATGNRKAWIEVQVNTLDSVMEELGLKHLDLLKIDVEGYELAVLKGAEHTLKNTSKVVVAAYHNWVLKEEERAVKKYLKSSNFGTVFSKDSYVYAIK